VNEGFSGSGDIDPSAPVAEMPVEAPRRAASLTLRSEDIRQSRAASMELANRSLADALRLTYRLLQIVMLVLLALFAFSGVRKIDQAEKGVRITLGQLSASDLDPGVHFSLPYPLGQIMKVSTSQVAVRIDESFYPRLSPEQLTLPPGELGSGDKLRPGVDGSLITGDGNLAHARFGVTYHRDVPADYIQALAEGQETALVKAAMERAAVMTIAEIPLDDILKRHSANAGTPGGAGAVGSEIEDRVRRTAQATLDQLQTGLRIDTVSLRDETPPLRVRQAYQGVQTAESKAATDRENAEKARAAMLSSAAGSAYPVVLALIDEYEKKSDAGDAAGAEATLMTLHSLFDGTFKGESLTVDGREFKGLKALKVEGGVSAMMSDAESYRSTVERDAQSRASAFTAKREQYLSNPRVFIAREWSEAMKAFLARDTVQSQMVPDEVLKYVLRLSEDPDIARGQQSAAQRQLMLDNPAYKQAVEAGLLPGEKK
jgi:membrane protease subunit HflK